MTTQINKNTHWVISSELLIVGPVVIGPLETIQEVSAYLLTGQLKTLQGHFLIETGSLYKEHGSIRINSKEVKIQTLGHYFANSRASNFL